MIKYGIAASLALLATLAHADGDYISPTNDRVRVSLGIMDLSSTTTLQVDSTTGTPGTVVNGEDQLGLSKDNIEPKIQAMVRAGSRNRIFFDYFTLDRTGNATLTEPIVFRAAVLQVGDPVQYCCTSACSASPTPTPSTAARSSSSRRCWARTASTSRRR